MHGSAMVTLTVISFFLTLVLILWRPRGLNEAIPAMGGAILVILSGSVSWSDLVTIGDTVSGAAITIMSTIVMAIILESFGFFTWAAEGLAARAKGSGIRLFWYVNLLCFLMTLFFNNDGSILITTPILLILLKNLGLKNKQKIPYLLSGALIATASSAPIGVSNVVNLIALKIVDMDLYKHTEMMFIPSTLGLLFLLFIIFLLVRRELPGKLPSAWRGIHPDPRSHPLKSHSPAVAKIKNRSRFMLYILLFVFSVRVGLFVASFAGIPVWVVAVIGSGLLLGWRWLYLNISPADMIKKTPWHILIFCFGMYVIIYGLHNIGLTERLISIFQPIVSGNLLNASLSMGSLISVMSILFNNHPALMVGTLTLTNMGLDPLTLKIAYLANVIGSDIGSLLLPIGTLASLMWMHILKQHHVKINWQDYIRVTFIAIPPTVIFTLVVLYYWVSWLF
ncbi:Arsenical pump membrane protein [Paenibacillus sp. CECT 9249]|uniref:arsenic transporter n=1 Tax=Paenibacillus sp. CECT 9249 TaxID=2845385 RepID=UPI001E33B968|nr:arsenic transporter [Paenibacillus sp. CECT 9249]CAH0118282.1 Arsenical pump membrane protein [Paenibacillus sp. CECT 9249]